VAAKGQGKLPPEIIIACRNISFLTENFFHKYTIWDWKSHIGRMPTVTD